MMDESCQREREREMYVSTIIEVAYTSLYLRLHNNCTSWSHAATTTTTNNNNNNNQEETTTTLLLLTTTLQSPSRQSVISSLAVVRRRRIVAHLKAHST